MEGALDKSTGEQLARYRQLRAAQKNLHLVLMKRLPRQAIEDGGKLLGIYRDGGLAFNSMDETSVLVDYCIYDYRWEGKNVIERYMADSTVELDSDQKVLLAAMLEARYSLFAVDKVVEGVGVETHDLLRGDAGFIIDTGLGETAVKGFIFAARIITPHGCRFSMTTGAALPADRAIVKRIADEIAKRFGRTTIDIGRMSRAQAAELSAFTIRVFLEGGASLRIAYEDPIAEASGKEKPKVGRNDPCPCGSGKKYKRCCGKVTEPVSPPDRRLMERDLRSIQKLIEGKDFSSIEEMNAFLRETTAKGEIPEWKPETLVEQAQELVYRALEARDKKERIRLAMGALKISQDCTDAYVLLAEEAAEVPEQARDWYQRGVEAGERVLGHELFKREAGHFWGIVETRPYMRARGGLAECLFLLGEHDAALEHFRDMLRLNPNDNQGIRYKLLSGLMEKGDIGGAEELLEQFEDEVSAVWLFTRALVTFIRKGNNPEARRQLTEAVKQNPHVVPYLIGQRRLPRTLPDYIGFGDESEAEAYMAEFGATWLDTQGALAWVRAVTRSRM